MTIKEVAELAGVSSAAVSRYLNGGPLSEEKKERIRKAIEQTGYHPSPAGRMLRAGRTNQIGVIVPKVDSMAVAHVTEGIAERLKDTDYMMVLGSCDADPDRELEYLNLMQANNVAGIILMGTVYTPAHAKAFADCKVPLLVTGQNFPGVHCIYYDDYAAAQELTRLMVDRGRTRFGFIGVGETDEAVGTIRTAGVQDTLEEAGLPVSMDCRYVGSFDAESGKKGVDALLAADPDIDAIICATDTIALGAMARLKELGKRVPEDVSLAGFGDSWAGSLVDPPLTTVHLYHNQCGTDAANYILALLEEPELARREIKLGYQVVERKSV